MNLIFSISALLLLTFLVSACGGGGGGGGGGGANSSPPQTIQKDTMTVTITGITLEDNGLNIDGLPMQGQNITLIKE